MTLYQELQSLTLKVLSFISDGEEKFGSQKIIKSNMSSEKGGAMQCYGKKGGASALAQVSFNSILFRKLNV